MRNLQKWQRTLDNGPKACEESERRLDDLIRKYDKDPDGIKAIPEAADKVGGGGRQKLRKADDFKRTMEGYRNVPERF